MIKRIQSFLQVFMFLATSIALHVSAKELQLKTDIVPPEPFTFVVKSANFEDSVNHY